MKKNKFLWLWIVLGSFLLIAIIGGIVYFASSGTPQITIGMNYASVYKANYGHLCCLEGALETLAGRSYADDVTSTTCSEYVDECLMTFYYDSKPWTLGSNSNVCYKIDGGSTRTLTWGSSSSLTLPTGSKIEFVSCGFNQDARPYYQWERKGSVYNLVGEENGKIFVENGCELSSELKGKVLSGVPNTVPKGYSYCINYITDFVQTATKTYQYEGDEVVCQARAVYGIDETSLKDGSSVKIQGDKISNVDCCPSESNCGSDFKFNPIVVRECTYSTECDNGGDLYPISQTTAGYFTCNDGTCVKNTKSVECTSDAVCQTRHGEGFACDLSNDNWGVCIEAPTGIKCGDGICDIGESLSSCSADCEIECSEGEKLVSTTKKVDCTIGFPFYWGCSEEVSKECKSSEIPSWLLGVIIASIILLLIGIIILTIVITKKLSNQK